MYLGSHRFAWRRWVCLFGVFLLGSGSLPAWAGTFSWTGGDGTSQLWSTGSNWSGGTAPSSASATIIQFDVTNNPGTSSNPLNQDIANPFVLNQMIFGSGASVSYYLGGNPLEFVVDGGVNPIFRNQGSQDKHIYNAIQVPSGTTLHLINDTWNMRLYGVISGDGTLRMEAQGGGGEWHLYGTNTYTGGTVYNGTANSNQGYCRLAVYASGGLGTGLVTLNGGNISTAAQASPRAGLHFMTANTSFSNNFFLQADSPIFASATGISLSGNVDTNGQTLYLRGTGSATISGLLSGSGSITKLDTGTWTLTGSLNHTGGTTVNGGVLVLAKSGVPFPGSGSTGQFGSAHTVTINSGGTLQVGANWILGDGLQHTIKVNGGTLEFANSDNYQGKIELTGGRITTSGGNRPWRTGNWGDGLITVKASSTSSTIEGSLCFVGTPSATKTTFSVEDGAAADDLVVSAVIFDHPGGYEGKMTLVKDGPGTMKLTGPLNHTGGTTVNGGVLVLAQPGLDWTTNGQFGSSGHVLTVNAGATLRLTERGLLGLGQAHQLIINGGTVEFLHETYQSKIEMTGGRIVSTPSGSIVHVWRTGNAGNGQITVKASANSSTIEGRLTLVKTASATKTTFDVADGPAAQDLIVSAQIVDHGGGYEGMELVKTGAGTMVLSGNNTYIGPTTILAGKLLLTGTHTPAATPGLYTVGASGLLGGTGTTNASVLVQGTIAPGTSVGTLNTGSQTWAPGGTYQWEIQDVDAGPGTGWDLVNITGTLDITATPAQPFVIDVVSLGAGGLPGLVGDFDPLGVYSWEIARTTDGVTGFSPEKFLLDLGDFQNYWHGGRWWVSLGNQGNSVFLNYAIPEPSSGLLALLALGALGLWRWLSRK